jgi:hypothetical protein
VENSVAQFQPSIKKKKTPTAEAYQGFSQPVKLDRYSLSAASSCSALAISSSIIFSITSR